jgi:hypothetical protein
MQEARVLVQLDQRVATTFQGWIQKIVLKKLIANN